MRSHDNVDTVDEVMAIDINWVDAVIRSSCIHIGTLYSNRFEGKLFRGLCFCHIVALNEQGALDSSTLMIMIETGMLLTKNESRGR